MLLSHVRSLKQTWGPRRNYPILSILILLLAGFCASGCGDGGPELGQVSGVVTLDGKPLPEAMVFFKHESGGRIARAVTDEAGRYELNFNSSNAGAIVGANTVRISTFVEALRDDAGRLVEGTGRDEQVPRKYNKETNLTVNVEPGSNEFNFELQS